MVQIASAEERRRAEAVEQCHPQAGAVRAEHTPQQIEHRNDAQGGNRSHAKRLHDDGSKTEFDVVTAAPRVLKELSGQRPGRIVNRRFFCVGPAAIDRSHDPVYHRTAGCVGHGTQHGSTRIGSDVPSIARLVEQIGMHMGILVHLERQMVPDGQRQVDFAHGVGGHVDGINQPAGQKKAYGDTARRVDPRGRVKKSIHVVTAIYCKIVARDA